MTTQIVFKIDPKLKKAAQKRAAREGITLSDLFQSAAQSFVAGKVTIGLTPTESLRPLVALELKKALRDVERGRNLSPAFRTTKEAIAYLKKNVG